MDKQFFTELSSILADKQELRLTIAKTGEQLTVLATVKGKHITASGTPEDMDAEFLSHMHMEVEAKTFTFSVSEAKKEEEEEEEEEKAPATEKEPKAKHEKITAAKEKASKPATKKTEAKQPTPEISPTEPKESEKELEVPAPENNAASENKETVFKFSMTEGKKLMEERKYKEAEAAFKHAFDLFPNDAKAKEEYEKAVKWRKAVEEL